MSSSNQNNNAGQTYGTIGGTTYTVGSGIGGNPYGYINVQGAGVGSVGIGSVTISADEIKAFTGSVASASPRLSVSVDGGEPSVVFQEMQPDGTTIKARFEPENGMAVSDLAKIILLMTVMKESSSYLGAALHPIAYIRKHNLERHFRFSAA